MKKEISDFLVDLRAVLVKHNAVISSCSCCGGCGVSGQGWGIDGYDLAPGVEYMFSVERIDHFLKKEST